MTHEELVARNARRRIFQIGFVARDIEAAMRAWIQTLSVGPWTVLTFTEETMRNLTVKGTRVTEPFKFIIAAARMGDMQIEIIQPVYGPTHLQAFLEERGEGFHHIKEKLADQDIPGFLSALQAQGIGVLQTGHFGPDVHYHLDTERALNFIYEIGNCADVNLPAGMQASVYPPPGG